MKTPDSATDKNVVRKTSEEIKKGLECCGKGTACKGHCPYYGPKFDINSCTGKLSRDALALINRLEGDNIAKAIVLEQLERERDAAIEALHDVRASVAGLVCMVDRENEKIPKWTSVAEHLPPTPGKYLVYSKIGTMYTSKFDPDIHKRWPHFGKVGVTHRMPRPEEPKEE